MLFLLLACLYCLSFAFASGDPLQLQSLDVHRVWKVDDIIPSELSSFNVIFVKNETSIILSSFLNEKSRDPHFFQELKSFFDPKKLRDKFERNSEYVQTQYSRDFSGSNVTETFPIDGCFDNTLSETVSLVTRSYEKTQQRQGALNLLASLLGVELDAGTNAGRTDVFEEKIVCSVGPGLKLQLQATVVKKKMRLHRQRSIFLHLSLLGVSSLMYSDWREVDGPVELELSMKSLACVTNETYLRC
ncbi:hypothetical protein OXX59_008252 [Metschnikowia pulcherrima]